MAWCGVVYGSCDEVCWLWLTAVNGLCVLKRVGCGSPSKMASQADLWVRFFLQEDVCNRRCQEEGCQKLFPAYNWPGSRPGVYCKPHALPGMVRFSTKLGRLVCTLRSGDVLSGVQFDWRRST